jgi:hypothetical protein
MCVDTCQRIHLMKSSEAGNLGTEKSQSSEPCFSGPVKLLPLRLSFNSIHVYRFDYLFSLRHQELLSDDNPCSFSITWYSSVYSNFCYFSSPTRLSSFFLLCVCAHTCVCFHVFYKFAFKINFLLAPIRLAAAGVLHGVGAEPGVFAFRVIGQNPTSMAEFTGWSIVKKHGKCSERRRCGLQHQWLVDSRLSPPVPCATSDIRVSLSCACACATSRSPSHSLIFSCDAPNAHNKVWIPINNELNIFVAWQW